jgi:hypothetical protein
MGSQVIIRPLALLPTLPPSYRRIAIRARWQRRGRISYEANAYLTHTHTHTLLSLSFSHQDELNTYPSIADHLFHEFDRVVKTFRAIAQQSQTFVGGLLFVTLDERIVRQIHLHLSKTLRKCRTHNGDRQRNDLSMKTQEIGWSMCVWVSFVEKSGAIKEG